MAETKATMEFTVYGTSMEKKMFALVCSRLNEDYWFGEEDEQEDFSVFDIESVDSVSIVEYVDQIMHITETLGINPDFELFANVDEDYGEHTILKIAREHGKIYVQESSYNIEEYGGDFSVFGSAGEADEEGEDEAREDFQSEKIPKKSFKEYFDECGANDYDSAEFEDLIEELQEDAEDVDEEDAEYEYEDKDEYEDEDEDEDEDDE